MWLNAEGRQDPRYRAVLLDEQGEGEVLGADAVVVQRLCLAQRERHALLSARRERDMAAGSRASQRRGVAGPGRRLGALRPARRRRRRRVNSASGPFPQAGRLLWLAAGRARVRASGPNAASIRARTASRSMPMEASASLSRSPRGPLARPMVRRIVASMRSGVTPWSRRTAPAGSSAVAAASSRCSQPI